MGRQFCYVILIATSFISFTVCQEGELFTSDNKVDCVNKMVDWCEKMKFSKEGIAVSMVSITKTDDSGNFWRILCASDSDGTNCTRNGSPWFTCSPDNKLTYMGTELKKDSTDKVDDGICNTTKIAFNDIFIQNFLDAQNVTVAISKGMESFFAALAELQDQFDFLRRHIFSDCFPFCEKTPFNRIPFDSRDSATELPDSSETRPTNQLERE